MAAWKSDAPAYILSQSAIAKSINGFEKTGHDVYVNAVIVKVLNTPEDVKENTEMGNSRISRVERLLRSCNPWAHSLLLHELAVENRRASALVNLILFNTAQ